jgi:HEPN domain-containing protein
LVRQWLSKAEEDLLVAEHLAEAGALSPSAVGFHAQQAAEKSIKAYLVHHQIDFPKTHDIDALLDLVVTSDRELSESLRDASSLTDLFVALH